jgi:hypothetical protein
MERRGQALQKAIPDRRKAIPEIALHLFHAREPMTP